MCKINRNTSYAIRKLQEKVKLEKNEIGIFISRDCIVTETYTGKTYKYRAYNFITGDTQYMGYKRAAIGADSYKALLSKLADFSFYNISYPEDGEELIDYIFTRVFKGFGFNEREEQIELSKHMYKVMLEQSISLSDIAVGLGKTHAYLVASIVYHISHSKRAGQVNINQPIIISTSSKRLQKAIVREYVPEISRMLLAHGIIEEEITAVIRKGRKNYICDIRLKNYLDSLDPNKKNPREYRILKSILEGNQVDLEAVIGLRNYDRERIRVHPKHCRSCPENKSCRYRKLLEQVNQPKYFFQVTNHNYMIADILKRLREQKPLLPDYKVVIYDEAHKLPDAYMTMCTVELEKNEILDLIKKIKPKNNNRRSSKLLIEYGNEFIKEVNLLFNEVLLDTMQDPYEESNKYPIRNKLELRQSLYRLRSQILYIILLIPDYKRREQIAFEKLGDHVDMLMSDEAIIWIEDFTQPKQTVIRGVLKKINEMLGQDLFNKDIAILLTSGTLSVNGDFSYIKNTLGIDKTKEIKEVYKLSPFNYYQNTLLYQADDVPYPNQENDEYIKKVAEKIVILSNASCGHALVLFTSYEVMGKIYKILKSKHMKYPLFILSRDNSLAIKNYQRSKNGILLACGSIWEGVNFTGDLLSHLIIVKLPFPIPDPITDYQKSQIKNDRKYKEDILIPQMLTKLKQGYGRAIRTETDTAVISILDIRANGNYREVVRQALPNCKITYNIEDITRFIQEKKSPEYFLWEK